ncbi:MAG: hypothetical protein QOG57_5885, partial [Pseudonocardiales bacterium]|nr:hypothetical protein [Pseudonocardiales bacterium]
MITSHKPQTLNDHRQGSDVGPPWWSLPIRPGERAYQFDRTTGAPAPGSGRPYPQPVLPPNIAAIEAERCGP